MAAAERHPECVAARPDTPLLLRTTTNAFEALEVQERMHRKGGRNAENSDCLFAWTLRILRDDVRRRNGRPRSLSEIDLAERRINHLQAVIN